MQILMSCHSAAPTTGRRAAATSKSAAMGLRSSVPLEPPVSPDGSLMPVVKCPTLGAVLWKPLAISACHPSPWLPCTLLDEAPDPVRWCPRPKPMLASRSGSRAAGGALCCAKAARSRLSMMYAAVRGTMQPQKTCTSQTHARHWLPFVCRLPGLPLCVLRKATLITACLLSASVPEGA